METKTPPPSPVVKYTPAVFRRLSDRDRKQIEEGMRSILANVLPGDERNWADYWAREYLRALEDTRPTEAQPLSPMICGCAQGAHEERRLKDAAMMDVMSGRRCNLGWPIR